MVLIFLGLVAFGIGFWLFFNRNPRRSIPTDPGAILSPADGRVIEVGEEERGIQIAIFLSLWDVHVIRMPCDGHILLVRHLPGRYRPAFGKSATHTNERVEIEIAAPFGKVTMTLIAGMIARRIVCPLSPGVDVPQGAPCGRIRLGSRVELLLPRGVKVLVPYGKKVKGGETVLARVAAST